MKKILRVFCLLAILCVAYLAVARFRSVEKTDIDSIEAGAGELADQVKGMYEEYGSAVAAQADAKLDSVVEQADEKLGDVVEQADAAIEKAVESAVEGAKEGFFESLKESIGNFFRDLTT